MTNNFNTDSTLKYKTNLKKRIIATFLDYTIFLLVTTIYIELFGHENEEGGKTVNGFLTFPIPTFWFLYFVVVESFLGATVSHYSLYLKVLTIDRKEIDLTHAFKRHLMDVFDFLFYGIPALVAIKNSVRHQRLGDMLAKTIVVDTTDNEQYFKVNKGKTK